MTEPTLESLQAENERLRKAIEDYEAAKIKKENELLQQKKQELELQKKKDDEETLLASVEKRIQEKYGIALQSKIPDNTESKNTENMSERQRQHEEFFALYHKHNKTTGRPYEEYMRDAVMRGYRR